MPWLTKVIRMLQPFTKLGQAMSYLIKFLKKVVDARRAQHDTEVGGWQLAAHMACPPPIASLDLCSLAASELLIIT